MRSKSEPPLEDIDLAMLGDLHAFQQADSVEDYVRRMLEKIEADSELRVQYSGLSSDELPDALEQEYWHMQDAVSGYLDIENAEIEGHLKQERGEKPH